MIRFHLNGARVAVEAAPARRLSEALREDLGLTGTKIGCNAGDCGACTVLLEGEQVCACLVPLGQVEGRDVVTVEGLGADGHLSELQDSFHRHGAAQCGICTPGMLIAASSLLRRNHKPNQTEVEDAIGGVLCRCTGYRKIVDAILDVGRVVAPPAPAAGAAVGARIAKLDGIAKLTGAERFGADAFPADCLWLRVIRSPHPSARFALGSLEPLRRRHSGLALVLSAADVPSNGFGVYPDIKDQPVLAAGGRVRYRGEAVLALVGDRATVEGIAEDELPIEWQVETPVFGPEAALTPGAPVLHDFRPDNVLVRGFLKKGDPAAAMAKAKAVAEGFFETGFVEHAYIEPEAGYARRVGDRIEIFACTQTPYMDRDEVALIMGFERERIRIIPSACGGGFGGKLDLSLQPLIALAAWRLDRSVRCTYSRPESMRSTTKRHPSKIRASFACDSKGKLTAVDFEGDFNTGAYASWGPTVANRVPVHATGPYAVPNARAATRAVYTNNPPAGAFRGFGVPQAAIAHEALMDELAARLGMDLLEFRHLNAIRAGDETATGQRLMASAGLDKCLEALRPQWRKARAAAEEANRKRGRVKRGVGIGCMWYGIGNTSLANPSSMRIGLAAEGRLTLYNGAVDIGQGSNTIMAQMAADALGVPVESFRIVMGDTDRTADGGKTSASRQTFVSGNAVKAAGEDLRLKLLRLANVGAGATIAIGDGQVTLSENDHTQAVDLARLPILNDEGDVLLGEGRFDPPTTPLDANGQGIPYATYGFAAQMAEVEVDVELGTVKVRRIIAAHDVGRAINPIQVEGQIHGGIAQGLGLALMEEYLPGRSENLHDYLIPTVGDMPEIEVIIIEDREPLGPYGAKGIGEPALIPTAPAILGAIHHATGARVTRVPATPERVLAAMPQRAAE
ncbi:MAG TPA: molybdopterin cofactor-binding domain-containing protein [Verrucomicrobiae bacterium]|nr:molybdopterin cofactor-binding domain-containing protein [Verrucomicrobiae bacterium]